MKTPSLLPLLASATWIALSTASHAAPSPEQIVDKWVSAVGGRAALEKIQTREAKGTFTVAAMGLNADMIYLGKAPNKRRIEFNFAGFGKAAEVCDGENAWSANPGVGVAAKTGEDLIRARREATFQQELGFTKLYPQLAVEGSTTVGDRKAWILKATTPEGVEELHYFDQDTGLLLRKDLTVEAPEGRVKAQVFLEDYRKVDGINIAHTVRMPEPASVAFIMKFTEVRHNLPIPDDRFTRPTE